MLSIMIDHLLSWANCHIQDLLVRDLVNVSRQVPRVIVRRATRLLNLVDGIESIVC